ncbi:DnaJ family domain-containing protein [Saccharococcus sp. Marseille-Q5394]|uniref:DnaJ family domain-containing protein n=1 Tax=Saccharococcus sp. Marseille-Q5394 TaxID=2972778 RepID=UPI0021C79599|nr:DnaJ family domain-containing protein [Saccharococcus sp. Marseille-Q5394]
MSDNSMPPYNDLIGDMLKKRESEDGMENLKGFGKPLPSEYFSGDTFQHFQRIAKDAGYKPHWLKLQHEISGMIGVISTLSSNGEQDNLQKRVDEVNEKIAEHNRHCPPPMLKGRISLDSLDRAKEIWS